LKIAIVDDDKNAYETLKSYLNELLSDCGEISYYPSGEEFLSACQPGDFDLIILDIFMGELTGMEVARKIRQTDGEVRIAFSTTSNEFASESYEVNACYYLHKPFEKSSVKAMLDRVNVAELEKMRTLLLPDGTSVVLRNIIYADCSSHCVTLHDKYSQNTVLRANFSKIAQLLCEYPYFFCPTKGIVVNFYEVAMQGNDTFKMSDGSIIPISRRKAKETVDAYSSFLFKQLRKEGE